ncbi:APC family permease [Micrococcus lylae]|uniref:APC family permease n=1 Tax=Micrococcus TaxID=1269 RepID=UPI0008A31182|nr:MULTISPECIES: APC family permease [Micrococcus]OFR90328.1 transporter [Micrococcus sp. HMSC067E09]WIK82996.1 APC family permease [Micrococcus lylae]
MSGTLQRTLTLPQATVIGVGSMVGAGAFTALGLAAALTGGHAGALYLALGLAAVVATCNALSTAQLATVHPASGGTYVYGREQLGPWPGFLAGWGFVTGKTASVAAMAATVGLYVFPDDGLLARVVGVAAVVVLTVVAVLGATRTAQVTVAILIPVLAVLALAVVAGLALGDRGGDADGAEALGDPSALGVLMAAGLLFFSFAGYARVATMGEEVIDPRRTIPRAVLGALAFTVVLYVLLAAGLLGALGGTGLALSQAPVRAGLEATLGTGWGWVALVAAALACVGAMLNLLTGISRTALAMAREGDLPRPLATVGGPAQTPWVGQTVVAVFVIVLLLATDILTVVGFSSFGVLVYYAVTNLSALTLSGDRPLRVPRAVNVLGLVLCLVLAFTLPPTSVLAMLGVFLIGAGGRSFARAKGDYSTGR